MVIPINQGYVTTYLIRGESKSILIDAGGKKTANVVLNILKKNKIKPSDISLILLTHGHTDHFGSANELQSITGAPIAIHEKDIEYARKGMNPPVTVTTRLSKELRLFIDRKTSKVLTPKCNPQIILKDGMELNEFGVDAKVIETPGHTAGSVSVILPTGNVFCGDLLMGRVANKFSPVWPLFTDNIELSKKSLEKLILLKSKIFHVAHGGPFRKNSIVRIIKENVQNRHSRYNVK